VTSTVWKRLRSVRESDAKSSVWSLPTDDEHLLNTGSPEDLFLNPEDFDIVPELIQGGEAEWTKENLTTANWYTFTLLDQSFSPSNWYTFTLYDQSFAPSNWYTFTAPTAEFYVTDI